MKANQKVYLIRTIEVERHERPRMKTTTWLKQFPNDVGWLQQRMARSGLRLGLEGTMNVGSSNVDNYFQFCGHLMFYYINNKSGFRQH